jgi:starch synthase (maltosyl-transferring)
MLMNAEGPRIYNLFPLLAGPLSGWEPHLERARQMGFNWIFVNPIQRTGVSGSLYSIADYYALNPRFIDPSRGSPEEQLRAAIREVHQLGMKLMVDLVINHTAADSLLLGEHAEWYSRTESGEIVHPGAYENNLWVSWDDLAAVDNTSSIDRDNLWNYWLNLVRYFAALGFDGFRCDAAYQVPAELWRFLISSARKEFPELRFFAETLGCTPEQTLAVAGTGFDYIFNSSKWWDFTAAWCLDQLRETAPVVPSLSFPESHDTARLAEELNGNRDAIRQRYVFSAVFSTGVMVPIGFEYGFRRHLHVVYTRPEDWENPSWDDTRFLRTVNEYKASQRIWNEDTPWEFGDSGNPSVVALRKKSRDGTQTGLVLLNKDVRQSRPFDRTRVEQTLGVMGFSSWPHPDGTNTLPPAGYQLLISG